MALLALHDVEDAHGFCTAIVCRSNLLLDHYAREDLTAYLVSECWLLSRRFEPGGTSFSSWAGATLRLRVVDWQRQHRGRTVWKFHDRIHLRPRPELVSLDADDSERDRLEQALTARDGDHAADRDEDLGRLRAERDRCRARDLECLGLEPDARAA